MPTRLHQILALEKSAKSATEGAITRAYHDAQKGALFIGLTRVYKPRDEMGDPLPSERKVVQMTTDELLARASAAWIRQADLVVTKDLTNQRAQANVIIDGVVLLERVPVTTLLYLEKMLVNVATMIGKLPVLDPEVDWEHGTDEATGLYRSKPEETLRTQKVPKAFVKAAATDKHPAQVDTFTEDVVVGTWQRTLFSGGFPAGRKAQLLARVERLQVAVKLAREYANQIEVIPGNIGDTVFNHLLGP